MNAQSQSGFKGTPIYMAPEILRDEPYTKSVDVCAFSIIVYEIMTGKAPFSNLNIPQLILKVGIQNIRPELTDEFFLFEDEDGFAKYFIASRGKEEKVILLRKNS